MKVVGVMSGTSLDGLDAALIDDTGRFLRGHSMPLGEVGRDLRLLAGGAALDARTIAEACHAFSLLHVELIQSLLGSDSADLVAIHGQTVYHAPPVSWQLLQPAVIVSALGIPVVFDLRQADLAAGGQGAPLTPLADAWFLREFAGPWAVVNLGGFVNVTLGPELRGFDVCPCNLWLDALALREFGVPYDVGGALAGPGSVHGPDLERILGGRRSVVTGGRRSVVTGGRRSVVTGGRRSVVTGGRRSVVTGGRRSVVANSLGTGDDALPKMESRGADALRTAIEAVALQIAEVVSLADDVFLAGGGAENATLVSRIASLVPGRVRSYDETGIPGQYREAAAWAWLGRLAHLREPTSLPSITGASVLTVGGCWVYPNA